MSMLTHSESWNVALHHRIHAGMLTVSSALSVHGQIIRQRWSANYSWRLILAYLGIRELCIYDIRSTWLSGPSNRHVTGLRSVINEVRRVFLFMTRKETLLQISGDVSLAGTYDNKIQDYHMPVQNTYEYYHGIFDAPHEQSAHLDCLGNAVKYRGRILYLLVHHFNRRRSVCVKMSKIQIVRTWIVHRPLSEL